MVFSVFPCSDFRSFVLAISHSLSHLCICFYISLPLPRSFSKGKESKMAPNMHHSYGGEQI